MTAQLLIDWHGSFVSNTYTLSSPEVPAAHTLTRTGANVGIGTIGSHAALVRASGSDTAGGTVPSAAQQDETGIAMLVYVDPTSLEGNGRILRMRRNGGADDGQVVLRRNNADSTFMVEQSWNNGNAWANYNFAMPATPVWIWARLVPSESVAANRTQVKVWADGDAVPGSFSTATNTGGAQGTSGNVQPLDTLIWDQTDYTWGFGLFVIDDNPDADMSAYLPGGGENEGQTTATLGAATLSATGSLGIDGAVSTTLAAAALASAGSIAIRGEMSAALAAAAVSASSSLQIGGAVSVTLGAATLSAGGVTQLGSGQVDVTLGDVGISSAGVLTIRGQVLRTLAPLGLASAGQIAIRGELDALLGPVTVVAGSAPPEVARFYGIGRGSYLPRSVLEAAATTGLPIELRISEDAYDRIFLDVIDEVERIRDYLKTKETTPIQ